VIAFTSVPHSCRCLSNFSPCLHRIAATPTNHGWCNQRTVMSVPRSYGCLFQPLTAPGQSSSSNSGSSTPTTTKQRPAYAACHNCCAALMLLPVKPHITPAQKQQQQQHHHHHHGTKANATSMLSSLCRSCLLKSSPPPPPGAHVTTNQGCGQGVRVTTNGLPPLALNL
jgi:hypothetical protein